MVNSDNHVQDRESECVLLFDGVCHMCNSVVRFLIRRDPRGRIRYASLQSDVGKRMLEEAGYGDGTVDTVVLIENGQSYLRSAAALRVCRKLKGAWPLLYMLIVVPRPLRDAVYNFIAKYRHRLFGRSDQCMIPSPSDRSRFLDV